jgi:hypothetical protein
MRTRTFGSKELCFRTVEPRVYESAGSGGRPCAVMRGSSPSRVCADTWLSCLVVHHKFLPRSDSDSLSTWVGAWICLGTVLSRGSAAPFGGGKLDGDGSKLMQRLDSQRLAPHQFLLLPSLSALFSFPTCSSTCFVNRSSIHIRKFDADTYYSVCA